MKVMRYDFKKVSKIEAFNRLKELMSIPKDKGWTQKEFEEALHLKKVLGLVAPEGERGEIKIVKLVLDLGVNDEQYEAILHDKKYAKDFLKTMTMEMEPSEADLFHLEIDEEAIREAPQEQEASVN